MRREDTSDDTEDWRGRWYETALVAHYRSLPPVLARQAVREGGNTLQKWRDSAVLDYFLSAVPELKVQSSGSIAGSSPDKEWLKGVGALFWWVFIDSGPHACLSFLYSKGHTDAPLERDKEAMLRCLGPCLLWPDLYAREWTSVLPLFTAPAALRGLCAHLRQACRVNNEGAALMLLRCLACLHGLHPAGCFNDYQLSFYAYQDGVVEPLVLEMLEHSNPRIVAGVLDLFLAKLRLNSESISAKLAELHCERLDLRVREAMVRCLSSQISWLALPHRRAFFETTLALAADKTLPPSLRCVALSALPEGKDSRKSAIIATPQILDVCLAAAEEQDGDPRVTAAAIAVLHHPRMLERSGYAGQLQHDLDRWISVWVRCAVRTEPDVPSLLDLAAKCAAERHVGEGPDIEAWWAPLPAELKREIEARLEALSNKRAPSRHTKGLLRKATRDCVKALTAWQLREQLRDKLLPPITSLLRSSDWRTLECGVQLFRWVMDVKAQETPSAQEIVLIDELQHLSLTLRAPHPKLRKAMDWEFDLCATPLGKLLGSTWSWWSDALQHN